MTELIALQVGKDSSLQLRLSSEEIVSKLTRNEISQ